RSPRRGEWYRIKVPLQSDGLRPPPEGYRPCGRVSQTPECSSGTVAERLPTGQLRDDIDLSQRRLSVRRGYPGARVL
ncbi:hypothetical protein LTR14_012301, partial [Exophiala xenobiotica]